MYRIPGLEDIQSIPGLGDIQSIPGLKATRYTLSNNSWLLSCATRTNGTLSNNTFVSMDISMGGRARRDAGGRWKGQSKTLIR